MGHPEHKCKKALTWHGFNAHTQQYLLTTGVSAQVLLRAGKASQSRGTEVLVVPAHPCLCLAPLRLKAAHAPIPNFRAGRVSPPLLLWEGGCSEVREWDSRASLRLETKGVKPSWSTSWSPPKAKPYAARLRNENYAARGFL